jgi:hypothetical protein
MLIQNVTEHPSKYSKRAGEINVISKASCPLHAGFLLGSLFDLEYGGDMFLRNFA